MEVQAAVENARVNIGHEWLRKTYTYNCPATSRILAGSITGHLVLCCADCPCMHVCFSVVTPCQLPRIEHKNLQSEVPQLTQSQHQLHEQDCTAMSQLACMTAQPCHSLHA